MSTEGGLLDFSLSFFRVVEYRKSSLKRIAIKIELCKKLSILK
jgi:hypothetical protein